MRTMNHSARPLDLSSVSVGIALVGLHSQNWIIGSILGVSLNLVLINVDDRFHQYCAVLSCDALSALESKTTAKATPVRQC